MKNPKHSALVIARNSLKKEIQILDDELYFERIKIRVLSQSAGYELETAKLRKATRKMSNRLKVLSAASAEIRRLMVVYGKEHAFD